MFNFCSLYSGSSGNSLFVETPNTKLLIDAGVSSKKIETALKSIDVDSSFENRKKIAAKNNINNYRGTNYQNSKMLRMLKTNGE